MRYTIPYSLKLSKPYRWSKGIQTHRTGFILKFESNGNIGLGESVLLPHIAHDPIKFAQQCELLLDGLDPMDDRLLEKLDQRECPPAIRCGVSSAYFSLHALLADKRLCDFFPGNEAKNNKIAVNALITSESPEDCINAVTHYLNLGQKTIKIKCTPNRALDIQRISSIRNKFPELKIRIDPNQSWDAEWIVDHMQDLEEFNIQYCEEPLQAGTSFDFYRHVREHTSIPIALDESITTLRDAEYAADRKAADFFVLKLQRLGGIDNLLKIANLAKDKGIQSVITSSMESTIGLTIGLHCASMMQDENIDCGLGTADFFQEDLAAPHAIIDGSISVPTAPGIGISSDIHTHKTYGDIHDQ